MEEVTIRRANLKDVESVLCMYKELHDVSPYKDIPFNEDASREWIKMHVTQDHGIAYVSEVNGKADGFIMGLLHNYPPNPEHKMAVETGWYVREDARKTRAGGLLVRKFEQVAKQRGAEFVSLGRLAVAGTQPKDKASGGYAVAEVHHLKKVG